VKRFAFFGLILAVLILGARSTLQGSKQAGSDPDGPIQPRIFSDNPFLQTVAYPEIQLVAAADASVLLQLPENHEFTEGFPLMYRIAVQGEVGAVIKEGEMSDLPEVTQREAVPLLDFKLPKEIGTGSTLEVDLNVPYCTTVQPKMCKFKSLKLLQPISISSAGKAHLDLKAEIQ
jgi:hypothetical protein